MAKIMMIQLQSAPYAGTAYLNGAVKSAGHDFVLYLSVDIEKIKREIENEKPDIIGFSCMSCLMRDILRISRELKKSFNIPIILGGPHPTLFPEVINEDCVDIICRGEGEFAFIELLNAIEDKKDYTQIKNLYVKKDKRVYKNDYCQEDKNCKKKNKQSRSFRFLRHI